MYANGRSKSAVKKRFMLRVFLAVSYISFGIYLCLYSNLYLGMVFIVLGIVWYFIFPSRSKRTHSKFYKKHINENYKARMLSETELSFEDNHFYIKDNSTESKFSATEIEEIIELKRLFVVKIKNGSHILLSKKDANITSRVRAIFNEIGVLTQDNTDWQWK